MDPRQRPVVVADYQNGELLELPQDCPHRSHDYPCDVVLHSHRRRGTGPDHPLAVCRCRAHGVSFTVYPPGFAPYGREHLETVLSSLGEHESLSEEVEATRADIISRSSRLHKATATLWGLLGIAQEGARVALMTSLGIPITLSAEAARARHLTQRTRALRAIVRSIRRQWNDLAQVLLVAGSLAGRWGTVFRHGSTHLTLARGIHGCGGPPI